MPDCGTAVDNWPDRSLWFVPRRFARRLPLDAFVTTLAIIECGGFRNTGVLSMLVVVLVAGVAAAIAAILSATALSVCVSADMPLAEDVRPGMLPPGPDDFIPSRRSPVWAVSPPHRNDRGGWVIVGVTTAMQALTWPVGQKVALDRPWNGVARRAMFKVGPPRPVAGRRCRPTRAELATLPRTMLDLLADRAGDTVGSWMWLPTDLGERLNLAEEPLDTQVRRLAAEELIVLADGPEGRPAAFTLTYKGMDMVARSDGVGRDPENIQINVVGQVSGGNVNFAQNNPSPVSGRDLDLVQEWTTLARDALAPVASDLDRDRALRLLDRLDREAAKPAPDHARLRTLLLSAKAVAEQAAGSVIGAGVLAAISFLAG